MSPLAAGSVQEALKEFARAKQPTIGKLVEDAMAAIERDNVSRE